MKRLLLATETVAAVFLLLISVLVGLNVVLRGVAGIALPDWFDGSRMLLGIALCWGIAITTYRGGHICVDLLWEYCGPRNRRRLDLVAAVVVALFLLPLMAMTWVKTAGTGTQATADLRLPLVPFLAVACVGLTAAAVLAVLRAAQVLRQPEEPAGADREP